jgi:Protein of unknown function (DUF1592)/Protein of unknown function (DUF1588)/PA14 domain/Cytochrome C oxidase, cbb3-type, subunit III
MAYGATKCSPSFSSGLALRLTKTALMLFAWLPLNIYLIGAERSGEIIYRQHCASCHGDHGEGVRDKYAEPLVGDRSLPDLARYIDKQMPEDKPELVSAEESALVADYIYEKFYSVSAQLRTNQPPIELSHLTVNQYLNTVADLLGTFHGFSATNAERGLKADYFNDGRNFDDQDLVFSRVESGINAHYDTIKPSSKIEKNEFAARWSGALFAPTTGDYEFIIQSPNGFRLWLNDRDQLLLNNWVRSGNDQRHVATLKLLGGRSYAIKLEAFREKKENIFSVKLRWKIPGQSETAIPSDYLFSSGGSMWYVNDTPFPPDDHSRGYEHGAAVSQAWDEATTSAAFATAYYVLEHASRYMGLKLDQDDAKAKALKFLRQFTERAFRMPLNEAELKKYVDDHFAAEPELDSAIRRVIVATLKNPLFLYVGLNRQLADRAKHDHYVMGSYLSYALWDSMPDARLADAIKNNKLQNNDDVRQEISRMLRDERATAKLKRFFNRWLRVDDLHGLDKDKQLFPDFTADHLSDLRRSYDLFMHDLIMSEQADYRQLFTSRSLYLNGRLGAFYGFAVKNDADFQKITVSGQPYAGILTHPLLMTGNAYSSTTSPIHRGVFISRHLLGRRLRSPPDNILPESPHLNPTLTTRERIIKQTAPNNCQTCHDMINPLGFTLEHYDSVGRYRTVEQQRPIDASGSYLRPDGDVTHFKNAQELGQFLSESPEATGAFVERLFKDVIKQPILAYGKDEKERLRTYFVQYNYNMRTLLAEMVISAVLTTQARAKADAQRKATSP